MKSQQNHPLDLPSQRAHDYLLRIGKLVEERLDSHLPPVSDKPFRLHEAMRYSMFAGGKRLRPALCYAAWESFGGKGDAVYLAMSALEMFHTFSLIHDDLPCMDDDDMRRGRPTAHKQYDEATAVLSGDALCIHAFALLAATGVPETVGTIAEALGTYGMIGGQVTDIESEGKKVDLATVEFIHNRKTAALIEASLLLGAQIAGAREEEIELIREYGRNIGLAFQVIDDILDITSTTEELGKDAGSDQEHGKATYPAMVGIDESREYAMKLVDNALKVLDQLPDRQTSILRDIAHYIVTRAN